MQTGICDLPSAADATRRAWQILWALRKALPLLPHITPLHLYRLSLALDAVGALDAELMEMCEEQAEAVAMAAEEDELRRQVVASQAAELHYADGIPC